MTNLLPVNFHNDTIFCVTIRNEPFTPVKPIVENMGIDWGGQATKLRTNKARWGIEIISIPTQSGEQECLCMPIRKLPAFFASINPKKVKAELRPKIELYQNECDNVLWDYWFKGEAKRRTKKPYELEQTTREQRKPLSDLVKTWAKIANIPFSVCWQLVNTYLKVKSITDLPPEKLPDAIAYVEQQLAFLKQDIVIKPNPQLEVKNKAFTEEEKKDIVENLKELRDKALTLDNTRSYESAVRRLNSYAISLYKHFLHEYNPDYKGMTDPLIYTLHYQTKEAVELAQKSTQALRNAYDTAIAVTLMS